MLSAAQYETSLLIPYSDAGTVDILKREGRVLSMEYQEDGILLHAVLEAELYGRLKSFIPGYTELKEEWET